MEQVKHYVKDLPSETRESRDHFTRIDEILSQKGSNCKFCGSSHIIHQCPAYGKKCSYRQKPNHFVIVCKSKAKISSAHMHAVDDSSSNHVLFISRDRTHLIGNLETVLVSASTKGQAVSMQIDTGASCTLISSNISYDLGKPALSRFGKVLQAYDGHKLHICGKFIALFENRNKYITAVVVVVDANKTFGLLGRDLIGKTETADQVHTMHTLDQAALSAIKGIKATMQLKEASRNIFRRTRAVPIKLNLSSIGWKLWALSHLLRAVLIGVCFTHRLDQEA